MYLFIASSINIYFVCNNNHSIRIGRTSVSFVKVLSRQDQYYFMFIIQVSCHYRISFLCVFVDDCSVFFQRKGAE